MDHTLGYSRKKNKQSGGGGGGDDVEFSGV